MSQPSTLRQRELTIRPAAPADAPALRRLAALDSAAPLAGAVLVAVVDGEVWAAISTETHAVVADPFRPTLAIAGVLRVRAEQLQAPDRGPARRRLRLPRPRLA
jgi:hypothetical protein